ncbi:hypothetical protein ACFFF5_16315 [Lederbergia wuyishanensis]|uniref:Uncharacterized protein n=1 Tax=Lederbergia wuyishanensis TaxID=1347903 RepID=A0ABU0D5Q5_9BACI|nr:hypothetical protein [Lederbergia wuyishanensis]MCJ8008333.1 hypothetical protein [Lederbergia wuyishanensis]MDQ0343745.1 hypothetical protein [Lederbergia wuyishanensis]
MKHPFQTAGDWIKRNARPLEAARWEYLFEGGSRDHLIRYLVAYQNEDGGFGHGIEPDFWLPSSSPMATWTAGQLLMEIGENEKEEIVEKMLKYLATNVNIETGMWESVLQENNQYPHAPWWHWNEGVQNNWMFNPSVELAAYLIHWSPEHHEAAQIGWNSIEKAVERLMNANEMDRHEVNNYQQFLKVMESKKETFYTKVGRDLSEVSDKTMTLAAKCIDRDVSTWSSGYKVLPLDIIDSPKHPLYCEFRTLVERNLQFFEDEVSEEGIWDIPWNWGSYPEEFPIARRYWQGILAVNRYKTLKTFEYI